MPPPVPRAPSLPGDLTTGSPTELRNIFDASVVASVVGLVAAVQAALPDLKAQRGAVLITGGAFGTFDPKIDAMAVTFGSMGLAIGKAAQRKTAGLLHHRLAREGVYVGEVVVEGGASMGPPISIDGEVGRGRGCVPADRASMGPPISIDGEVLVDYELLAATKTLQWGRRLASTESVVDLASRVDLLGASMGPPISIDGELAWSSLVCYP